MNLFLGLVYKSNLLYNLDFHLYCSNCYCPIWRPMVFDCSLKSWTMALVFGFWRWVRSKNIANQSPVLVGGLLWGQIVTTIPTSNLPRSFTIGSGEVESADDPFNNDEDMETHEKRSGQILWIRGLTRLQTQVGFWHFFELENWSYSPNNLHLFNTHILLGRNSTNYIKHLLKIF